MQKALFISAILVCTVLAGWFRLQGLDEKPLHGDEANQAVKTGILFDTGAYAYDPHEHHGPSLYYGTLPILWLTANNSADAEAWAYRLVPALSGIGLVLIVFLLKDAMPLCGLFVAAVLTAVSPAMTYYSRYYIQEIPLVFFTMLAIAAGWRYWCRPHWGWALLLGVALGLMHATKETCVLAWAAMAGGVAAAWVLGKKDLRDNKDCKDIIHWKRDSAIAVVVALGVSVVLFSSFFSHWRGPLDSILTYSTYLGRAGGEGSVAVHDKPWYYYLSLLAYTKRGPGPWWSEGLVLGLAAVGFVAAWVKRTRFLCFLATYTLLLTAVYCVIAYKTPWSMLSFYHGMILLAGMGAAALVEWVRFKPLKAIVILCIVAGTFQLGKQAWATNFAYAADVRNPYVYAHTSSAFLRLVQRMEDLAAVAPEGKGLRVQVIAGNGDYWPLPWYLRAYTQVGYYGSVPDTLNGDVIIVGKPFNQTVSEQLTGYHSEVQGLRPSVLLQVFVKDALWEAFMATRR